MSECTCAEFRELSAELALGVLDGRQRADALAHLQRCPACREELLVLGQVADRLVALAPPAEPPAGFETRVLRAVTPPAAPPSSVPRRPRRGFLAVAAAAAVALLVAGGAGGWLAGRGGRTAPPRPAAVTAALHEHHEQVGQVVETNGAHPWVWMAVTGYVGQPTVICQVRGRDGRVRTLGTFHLTEGYGYWAAPVPPGTGPLAGARLVSRDGRTLATATFN